MADRTVEPSKEHIVWGLAVAREAFLSGKSTTEAAAILRLEFAKRTEASTKGAALDRLIDVLKLTPDSENR